MRCLLVVLLVWVGACDSDVQRDAAPDHRDRDLPGVDRPATADRDLDKLDRAGADWSRPDRALDSRKSDVAKPDSNPCATWAGWSCPTFAAYYCKAFCGTGQTISCDTVSCTCTVGGSTKACTNTQPGYCKGCEDALASGCCQ